MQWHTISKSEIELIDYIVKILGTWKEALSVYYMRQMHSTLALREAERSNLVLAVLGGMALNKEMDFYIFRFVACFH